MLETGGLRESGIAEHVEHAAVVAQDVGVERRHAGLTREARELLEQTRPDAVALHRIRNGKRHFRTFGRVRVGVIAGKGDNPPARLGHQCGRLTGIGADELEHLRVRQVGQAMETVAQAFG